MTSTVRGFRGTLHAATADLHHYIETETEVGRRMTSGTPDRDIFVAWLSMEWVFARMVRSILPPACRRDDRLLASLSAMGVDPRGFTAANAHRAWLGDTDDWSRERRLTGTAYVVCGAVFGGEVIARRLAGTGFPTDALGFVDRETEVAFLGQLRQRGDCAYEARRTFTAMIECCREVEVAS